MSGSISRRLFPAFAWIIVLLVSQGLLSVLSQRHLMAEFQRLEQACADSRSMLTALHGANTEVAILVGTKLPDGMDEHLRRYRDHMGEIERLSPSAAPGPLPVPQLKAAYEGAVARQYRFAFEMARQELAGAVPLHSQVVEGVAQHLAAMETVKAQALKRSMENTILGALALGALAIGVALFWADRLNQEFTDRREAEASLAKALQMHRNLLDASTQFAIIMPDAEGLIHIFNRGAERMLGWTAEDVVGKRTPELWHDPEEVEARRQELQAMGMEASGVMAPFTAVPRVKGSERRRWTFVTRSGERRTVELVVTRVLDPGGEIQGFLGIATDITEQLKTEATLHAQEEQLHQSQKMDAVGQLAGGVAHDFNNMLAAILGSAELLAEDLPEGSSHRGLVQTILKASGRAAELTSKLLAFSRKGKLVSTALDLHRVVQDTLILLERSVDKRIEIRQSLRARHPQVVGDPSQLENALLNLCINARDAMPEGGVLTIETENLSLEAPLADPTGCRIEAGAYVRLSIRDTGHGIPPEIRERIFEPFFTTKAEGRGTGLGLSAVYGIVKSHRGALKVDSEPGQGSVFHILLPLDEVLRVQQPQEEVRETHRGEGTILVIDDEEMIRSTTTRMLDSAGYRVLLAADGAEGIRLFEAHGPEISLVLLDLVMPGLSGRETFQRLHRLDPRLRIIAASGFANEQSVADMVKEGLVGFLHKPYGMRDLLESIRKALTRSSE